MKRRGCSCQVLGILMLKFYLACAYGRQVSQRVESTIPIATNSPPEGNTTFVDGVTFCVALPGVPETDLVNALNWACGPGGADCSLIQPGGPCYQPDTLLSHASFAFNSYYQQNGNSDIACNFGGTGSIVRRNPSYGSCRYLSSEQSAAPLQLQHGSLVTKILGIYLLLFLA